MRAHNEIRTDGWTMGFIKTAALFEKPDCEKRRFSGENVCKNRGKCNSETEILSLHLGMDWISGLGAKLDTGCPEDTGY